MQRLLAIFLALTLGAYLAGCGTDSSSGDANDDTASADTSTDVTISSSAAMTGSGAKFSLSLTDAPIDGATQLILAVFDIELRKTGGGWIKYDLGDDAVEVDLIQLQGTKTLDILENVDVEPGDYNEIRLILDGSPTANYINFNGTFEYLNIPSGSSSGLKIKGDFTVGPVGTTVMIADFDLRQSVKVNGGGQYRITPPVVRLVDADDVGHVRGTVDPAMLTAPTCSDVDVDTFNVVYVYEGHNAVTDDINQSSGSNNDPIATATINYDTTVLSYLYEAAFLPAGDYTIAFTCNSDLDDLDSSENLLFFNIQNVTVLVNDITFL